MNFLNNEQMTRREFLRRSGQLALAGTALPFALNLAAFGEASAFSATDYKALVCVFLFGGNDYANTVVNYDDPSYNAYNAIRGGGAGQTAGGLALSKTSLAQTLLVPTVPLGVGIGPFTSPLQYALNPAMTGLAKLFNTGHAAVQLNVGPLVVPLTRAQYSGADRTTYPLPPKLFSHNDQQSIWQSSQPEGSTIGWGGTIGDLALSNNTNSLFTCISVSGNAVMLSGNQATEYQISTGGAVAINGVKTPIYGSYNIESALATLVQQPRTHAIENEYNKVTTRSIAAEAQVTAALAGVTLNTVFPTGSSLAAQLKIVARMIGAQAALGAKRQVFFVSVGGFDMHQLLINNHGPLLGQVSDALAAFYQATVDLGVANQVTAFTASDFGRTLTSNGNGSDHGWGNHHFVVGGAVKGAAFYGSPPPVSVGNTSASEDQWHVGSGRLLPTTSVDQYAATFARWFGVADSDLSKILPNISNFGGATGYPINLGILG